MHGPLFSTYSQGENRVTASILAVVERIDIALVQRIIESATASEFPFVTFVNQSGGTGTSVPDARISASFNYLLETKIEAGAVGRQQIANHLEALDGTHVNERLLVITPDAKEPEILREFGKAKRQKLVWFNFRALDAAISSILDNGRILVPELQRYLLRELQEFLAFENLIYFADVVVVPARDAFDFYKEHSVYICQAGRSFRPGITHLAFYFEGAIQPYVAKILKTRDNYVIDEGGVFIPEDHGFPGESKLEQQQMIVYDLHNLGLLPMDEPFQIFWLSGISDETTIKLESSIVNARANSGRGTGWVQNQRYVSLANLTAGFTSTDQLDTAAAVARGG